MLYLILGIFVGCFVLECAIPGWPLPKVKTWPLRVLLINGVQLGVILLAGITWEVWLSSWSIFSLTNHVSPVIGGLLAYFIATFVFYWWHRWRHEYDFLWLTFHQIHHSPQRLEVITSFYKHPGEMIVNSVLGSLLVYTTLGLSIEAGLVYTACTGLVSFSITPMLRHRNGLVTFSNARKCTVFITSTIATKTTMVISSGGTCCLAHTRIQKSGSTHVALMMRKNNNYSAC